MHGDVDFAATRERHLEILIDALTDCNRLAGPRYRIGLLIIERADRRAQRIFRRLELVRTFPHIADVRIDRQRRHIIRIQLQKRFSRQAVIPGRLQCLTAGHNRHAILRVNGQLLGIAVLLAARLQLVHHGHTVLGHVPEHPIGHVRAGTPANLPEEAQTIAELFLVLHKLLLQSRAHKRIAEQCIFAQITLCPLVCRLDDRHKLGQTLLRLIIFRLDHTGQTVAVRIFLFLIREVNHRAVSKIIRNHIICETIPPACDREVQINKRFQ